MLFVVKVVDKQAKVPVNNMLFTTVADSSSQARYNVKASLGFWDTDRYQFKLLKIAQATDEVIPLDIT